MNPLSARTQLSTAQGFGLLPVYRDAAKETGIDVAVLLGKDSRESRLTRALSPGCTGDRGNGFGISQIDRRFYPVFTERHNPCDHASYIRKGAQILKGHLEEFGQLRPALAAYNAGPESVSGALQEGRDVDSVTTGGDYSQDALSRAETFRELLPERAPSSAGIGAPLAGLLTVTATAYSLTR